METLKRSGDSTHPCRSPTPTMNDRDLTLLTWTETSEQEYSDFMASNRQPSTPYSSNTPKSFTRNLVVCFIEVNKACEDVFNIFPKYCQRVKYGLLCYGRDKNRTGYHSALIQLFCSIFFQGIGNINVNYLKIPKKHCRSHKTPKGLCGPHAAHVFGTLEVKLRMFSLKTFNVILYNNYFQSAFYNHYEKVTLIPYDTVQKKLQTSKSTQNNLTQMYYVVMPSKICLYIVKNKIRM